MKFEHRSMVIRNLNVTSRFQLSSPGGGYTICRGKPINCLRRWYYASLWQQQYIPDREVSRWERWSAKKDQEIWSPTKTHMATDNLWSTDNISGMSQGRIQAGSQRKMGSDLPQLLTRRCSSGLKFLWKVGRDLTPSFPGRKLMSQVCYWRSEHLQLMYLTVTLKG